MKNLVKTKGFLIFALLISGSLLFISAQGNNKTVTLELWTPNANTICQNGEVILAEAIAAFEKKNPQIKISHQYKGYYDEYKAALSEAFASNTEPDIFAGFPGSFLESYRQQNQLLALDNYLSAKFKAGILKGALPNVSAGGKIYGIPFTGHIALILCNTEIFEQNNLAYPQTFDELVEVCKTLKEKGIIAIAHSNNASDKWPNIFLYETLALRHGGYEAVIENGVKKANFNDEAFLKAAEDIKALVDAGAFPENLSSLSYGDGINLFSEGKAAMCFTGQWVLGMIGETNPLVTENKIKVIRFPSVVNGKGDARDAWGGAFAAFMVSARSKYKKEAAAFGEFLSEYIARQNYVDSQDIPLCRVAEKPKETTFLKRQIHDLAGDSAALAPGWDVFLREEDRDIYWTSLFYLFSGINTPEQFFEALPGNGR